jgi:hypothetical protein
MDLTGDYRYSEMSSLIEQETGKHPQPQPSTTTPTISLSAYTYNYVMRSASSTSVAATGTGSGANSQPQSYSLSAPQLNSPSGSTHNTMTQNPVTQNPTPTSAHASTPMASHTPPPQRPSSPVEDLLAAVNSFGMHTSVGTPNNANNNNINNFSNMDLAQLTLLQPTNAQQRYHTGCYATSRSRGFKRWNCCMVRDRHSLGCKTGPIVKHHPGICLSIFAVTNFEDLFGCTQVDVRSVRWKARYVVLRE